MDGYKFSKYNYQSKDNVLFNFYSGQMLKIPSGRLLGEIIETKEIRDKFIDKGFLVCDDVDETLMAQLRLNALKYGSVLRLTIYPTEHCNFRCTYCYEDFENCCDMDEITEEAIVSYVRKNIHLFSMVEVTWFGGEPLLKAKLIIRLSQKLISICKAASRAYRASCITNGYLLTLPLFRELLKCKISTFMITLDGDIKYHDSVRKRVDGAGTYNTIYSNLKDIKLNSKKSSFRIKIRVNVSFESVGHFEEYLLFLEKEFGNDIRFSFMFRPVGNWEIENRERNLFVSVPVSEVYKLVSKSKVKLNCIDHYLELCNSVCEAAFMNSFIIKPNRDIHKCNLLKNASKNRIGNLDERGHMQIYNEILAEWIIRERKEKCRKCFMACACGEGDICVAKKLYYSDFDQNLCGYNKTALDDLFEMLIDTNTIKYMPYEEILI